MAESRIVAATGQATMTKGAGRKIERAMAAAVQDAYNKGITDPDEIRRLQLEAREAMKQKLETSPQK